MSVVVKSVYDSDAFTSPTSNIVSEKIYYKKIGKLDRQKFRNFSSFAKIEKERSKMGSNDSICE